MNKAILGLVLAGVLLAEGVSAASVKAELVMSGGRSWKGFIVGRDGDWIEFQTGNAPRPIRLGANTITELIFEVNLDEDRLMELKNNLEYQRVITALEKAVAPFAEFSDIPSNLTRYNALMMELNYLIGAYDKSLTISSKIAEDDRDPELQEKGRVFQALALIDAGRADEAAALLGKFGWDEEIATDEAAPEKLYIAAKLEVLKNDYSQAMEFVAKVIAFNSQNLQWMQPAELLCAEIYTEMGATNPIMLDSAEEVIRQISLLYKNTLEYDKAQELKVKIDAMRAELELKENLESEDA